MTRAKGFPENCGEKKKKEAVLQDTALLKEWNHDAYTLMHQRILLSQHPGEKFMFRDKFLEPKQKHKQQLWRHPEEKWEHQIYLRHQAIPCTCLHGRLLTNFIRSSFHTIKTRIWSAKGRGNIIYPKAKEINETEDHLDLWSTVD